MGKTMDRDELARQGKQMASDLRDTVGQKVSENQDTISAVLGKAARWVDEKTGGKYSDQIGRAQAKVDEGVGWVASQGAATSGEPHAPGATAGDPAPGGAATPPPPATAPPAGPDGFTAPAGPGASAGDPAPTTRPASPPPSDAPTRPSMPRPDFTAPDPDAPRPPQV
ncbi:hypothetical protein GCM10023201_12820 [Actinomycetospora corticicola]